MHSKFLKFEVDEIVVSFVPIFKWSWNKSIYYFHVAKNLVIAIALSTYRNFCKCDQAFSRLFGAGPGTRLEFNKHTTDSNVM